LNTFVDHFAAVALSHIDREYPSKLDHVINEACEVRPPRELHPVFYGSYDWHSSVHGHWLLARALRLSPGMAQAGAVRGVMDAHLTAEKIAVEVAYLKQARRETFERTYGWAWLLKLAAELRVGAEDEASAEREAFVRWDEALGPLTRAFVGFYFSYLPKARYPIRVGTHQNTAFGLALAVDYANAARDTLLRDLLAAKARAWYMKDEDCPAWEPDGTDFLSPSLMEAECMRRVLPSDEFAAWLGKFLPRLAEKKPAALFAPAEVSDRADAQLAHLDGLNLSRAWCWRSIGRALPGGDARRALAEAAYEEHLRAALPHVTGEYAGEHWLATFAMLAMTE